MNKEQRQDLIRQRFKAKAGKMQYVGTGRKRMPTETPSGRINVQSFGLAMSHKWGRTHWLETPDKKPEAGLGKVNRKGVPAVTLIAAKAPKKLVRQFRNAEAILAARGQR